jgi:hypothetical protein
MEAEAAEAQEEVAVHAEAKVVKAQKAAGDHMEVRENILNIQSIENIQKNNKWNPNNRISLNRYLNRYRFFPFLNAVDYFE